MKIKKTYLLKFVNYKKNLREDYWDNILSVCTSKKSLEDSCASNKECQEYSGLECDTYKPKYKRHGNNNS